MRCALEAKETIPFQTETRKLLQMMIHSVYTEKEVFLRELISNASDAIDRRYALALSKPQEKIDPIDRNAYMIRITPNKEKRLLTISDNGIGMDAKDLQTCLGTIAFSSVSQHESEHREGKDAEALIGKFGIGFYSLFMAADHVRVVSRKIQSDKAYAFESDGIDSFTIKEAKRSECGTDVILHLREEEEPGGDEYSRYLREYTIYQLVKKYSDYIHWPIRLLMPIPVPDEHGEPTERWSYEKLNSMTPIWNKPRNEVTEEEMLGFFYEHYAKPSDFTEREKAVSPPLKTLLLHIEGNVEFSALIYIPSAAWKTWDTAEDKKGLELYSRGVRIAGAKEELLPEAFPFLKGAVEISGLSLNLTREGLQSNAQLKAVRNVIYRRVSAALLEALADNRTEYEKFFHDFGRSLKLSAMECEGKEREDLQKLLLFETSTKESPVTLPEYIDGMILHQKAIFFAKGPSRKEILRLPEAEKPLRLGIPFLCFTDMADELCARVFSTYQNLPFRALSDRKADLRTETGSPFSTQEEKELLAFICQAVKPEVREVIASSKLEKAPVLLSSDSGISFAMEEDYRRLKPDAGLESSLVLEVNLAHPALAALNRARKTDPNRAVTYAHILYQQARLLAGLKIEDPGAYTDLVVPLFK
jgi:molecular chaperone HtpG